MTVPFVIYFSYKNCQCFSAVAIDFSLTGHVFGLVQIRLSPLKWTFGTCAFYRPVGGNALPV